MSGRAIIAFVACGAVLMGAVFFFADSGTGWASRSRADMVEASADARLISYQPLAGTACLGAPVDDFGEAAVLWRGERSDPEAQDGDRAPVRVIQDPAPTYSAIAVDGAREEVVLQDENLFQIMVYHRLDSTPIRAAMTEPRRVIGGVKTKVEFNCGLYVDPENGDIYSVANDTVDTLVIFSRQARGNVPPDRELHTPHGTYGIAVDERHQELFLTVQQDNAVVVYHKLARGEDAPIRTLQGNVTGLEDPHGIAFDPRSDWIFVSNHGHVRVPDVAGTGKFEPPSITVYRRPARGNTPPVRVIEGSRTQLNWPAGLSVDSTRGELFVANDVGDSILVFSANAARNAAPVRVLRGPKTGIKNPTGIFVDAQNNELWVANFGNHSATVYPLTAAGDTPPLRTIRAAARGKLALGIGNPGAVAYDSKRREILVPN